MKLTADNGMEILLEILQSLPDSVRTNRYEKLPSKKYSGKYFVESEYDDAQLIDTIPLV